MAGGVVGVAGGPTAAEGPAGAVVTAGVVEVVSTKTVRSGEDSRTTIGAAGPLGVRQPTGVSEACLSTGLAACAFAFPLAFALLPRFMAEALQRSPKYSTLVLIEDAEQSEAVLLKFSGRV